MGSISYFTLQINKLKSQKKLYQVELLSLSINALIFNSLDIRIPHKPKFFCNLLLISI
jgi:hypothetical protein